MITYKEVYFNIQTPSYYNNKYGVGWEEREHGELFKEEIKELFLNDGWTVKEEKYKSSGGCDTMIKDKQELYLHPQQVSGVVFENNILYIENLLTDNNLFTMRFTKTYEEIFDITDDEYIKILEEKREQIENDFFEVFTTKRSNLYITEDFNGIRKVFDKYHIKRLSKYMGFSSSDIDFVFMIEMFENLVEQKKIITAKCKKGNGYRTDKKYLNKVAV